MIDIIRGDADAEYLNQVACECFTQADFELQEKKNKLASVQDAENANPNLTGYFSTSLAKKIVFLDRNNTPDIWSDIS